MTKTLWVVGGFIRDSLLGFKAKDIDFAIEADSYQDMKDYLIVSYPDIEIVREDAVYGRLIAGIPTHYLKWTAETYKEMFGKVPPKLFADFVLSRCEGDYTDGQHPDKVTPASIEKDLGRRDFTMNAIAVNDSTGEFLDPFKGVKHIEENKIYPVGSADERFSEHIVRLLRYYRFQVTKGMMPSYQIDASIIYNTGKYAGLLTKSIFRDSIRQELEKMFKFNSYETLTFLARRVPTPILKAILVENKLNLLPTYKQL